MRSTGPPRRLRRRELQKPRYRALGDDALYITTLGIGLNVKKGDTAFTIRVYGFPKDQMQAKEKTLALDALSKLWSKVEESQRSL